MSIKKVRLRRSANGLSVFKVCNWFHSPFTIGTGEC